MIVYNEQFIVMFWTPCLLYLFRYGKQESAYPLEDEVLMFKEEDGLILKDDGHLLFILFQRLYSLQGEFVFMSHIIFIKRLTPSVRIYRAFSIIMLYLICLYIGSATNFARMLPFFLAVIFVFEDCNTGNFFRTAIQAVQTVEESSDTIPIGTVS